MVATVNEQAGGRILEVTAMGKLTKEDYKDFIPWVERLIERHGKISVLFQMHDFHGWTAGALWEDLKLDLRHFRDIDRLAMVGEKRWQKGMSIFCKPFTTAQIRYYEHHQIEDARSWLKKGTQKA
jgi:hypothetical protein